MTEDLLFIITFSFPQTEPSSQLLLKYLFPVVTIGIAYGTASTPLCRGRGAHGKFFPRRRAMPCLATLAQPANPEAGGRDGRAVVRPPETRGEADASRRNVPPARGEDSGGS